MPTTQRTYSPGIAGALKQDPKKVIVLGVLIALMLGLWVKMALSGHSPKAAMAMTVTPSATPSMIDSNNKAKAVDTSAILRDWVSEPLPQGVSRNIFEVQLDYYPMDLSHPTKDSGTINDPT